MRTLFLVLLLANVAFYAYTQFFHWSSQLNDAEIREINADKITRLTTPIVTATPDKSIQPAEASACLRWTGLSSVAIETIKPQLATLQLNVQQEQNNIEKTSHWVYIPPRLNLVDAQRKATELNRLGIREHFVINDGSAWQNAISLGVFSTQEAAKQHLKQLQRKGVRSAVEGEKKDTISSITLHINQVTPKQQEDLQRLANNSKGSQLQTIDCLNASAK